MSWRIGNEGFEMTLSPRVPDLIGQHLRPWLETWLAHHGLDLSKVGSWAVHPGGPRILSAVAEATGNRVLFHSMHAVRDVIRRMLMTVFRVPGSAARAVEEHRAIRAAIADGDPTRARDEMRAHLARVELDVQKGGGDG